MLDLIGTLDSGDLSAIPRKRLPLVLPYIRRLVEKGRAQDLLEIFARLPERERAEACSRLFVEYNDFIREKGHLSTDGATVGRFHAAMLARIKADTPVVRNHFLAVGDGDHKKFFHFMNGVLAVATPDVLSDLLACYLPAHKEKLAGYLDKYSLTWLEAANRRIRAVNHLAEFFWDHLRTNHITAARARIICHFSHPSLGDKIIGYVAAQPPAYQKEFLFPLKPGENEKGENKNFVELVHDVAGYCSAETMNNLLDMARAHAPERVEKSLAEKSSVAACIFQCLQAGNKETLPVLLDLFLDLKNKGLIQDKKDDLCIAIVLGQYDQKDIWTDFARRIAPAWPGEDRTDFHDHIYAGFLHGLLEENHFSTVYDFLDHSGAKDDRDYYFFTLKRCIFDAARKENNMGEKDADELIDFCLRRLKAAPDFVEKLRAKEKWRFYLECDIEGVKTVIREHDLKTRKEKALKDGKAENKEDENEEDGSDETPDPESAAAPAKPPELPPARVIEPFNEGDFNPEELAFHRGRWRTLARQEPPGELFSLLMQNPYGFKRALYDELLPLLQEAIAFEGWEHARPEFRAFNLSVMFSNRKEVERYLENAALHWRRQDSFLVTNAAGALDIPANGAWDIGYWKDKITKYGPVFTENLPRAVDIENHVKRTGGTMPATPAELKALLPHIKYRREGDNPVLGKLAHTLNLEERTFDLCVDFYAAYKKEKDCLPDIFIDGSALGQDDYYLRRLPPDDVRGLLLGEFSSCCQSIGYGNMGEKCTEHGMSSPYGGFYVWQKKTQGQIREEDPIVAQSWAWVGQDHRIVFDSYERAERKYDGLITPFIMAFRDSVRGRTLGEHFPVAGVRLGKAGKTPVLAFKDAADPSSPIDFSYKRDSFTQYEIETAADRDNKEEDAFPFQLLKQPEPLALAL